jgi:hypothetical protein
MGWAECSIEILFKIQIENAALVFSSQGNSSFVWVTAPYFWLTVPLSG